jgi:hypothetical protein
MAVNDIANIAGTYGHYLSKFVKEPNLQFYFILLNFQMREKLKVIKLSKGMLKM